MDAGIADVIQKRCTVRRRLDTPLFVEPAVYN